MEVTRAWITLIRVLCSYGGDGIDDQDCLVHVGEPLNMETSATGGVLAEFLEQRLMVVGLGQVIQNDSGLARRKTGQRHVALAPIMLERK